MQYLNIREMRSIPGKLDQLVEEQQELIITRNKREIARVLPIQPKKTPGTCAQLRQLTQTSAISSADLIRLDRDYRESSCLSGYQYPSQMVPCRYADT